MHIWIWGIIHFQPSFTIIYHLIKWLHKKQTKQKVVMKIYGLELVTCAYSNYALTYLQSYSTV